MTDRDQRVDGRNTGPALAAANSARGDVLAVGTSCADILVGRVDEFPAKASMVRTEFLHLSTGGVAATYARDAARLGLSAAVATGIGMDVFGQILVSAFEKDGVDWSPSVRHADLATAATVVLVDSRGERSFLHHAGASDRLPDPAGIDGRRWRHVHLGGLPMAVAYGGESGTAFARRMRDEGATVSMDTVLDPCGGWETARALLPELDIALPSYVEAVELSGGETDPVRQVAFMLEHGVRVACVKLGSEGAIVAAADRPAFYVRPTPLPAVDVTGAGEAFCAGFTYGWLRGWTLEKTAMFAATCGALATQATGGPDGLRSAADVARWAESSGFAVRISS